MAKLAARDANPNRVRPGPRRPEGAPAGPDAVRDAVIEAAGHLFATDGVDAVSLRAIAAAADVQLALIPRYFGSRDNLIEAVFDDLTTKIAQGLVDRPLQQVSFDPDSAMTRWTALLNHFAATGKQLPTSNASFNPVQALAKVFEQEYGQQPLLHRASHVAHRHADHVWHHELARRRARRLSLVVLAHGGWSPSRRVTWSLPDTYQPAGIERGTTTSKTTTPGTTSDANHVRAS